jgi:hypothetical protein
MLEAGSSKDPAANASVTTQDNRQSPSPDIHATLFSTGHPPERRGSRLPSSTLAPSANGHTPHDIEPISAVLGFETRLKCHNDVVTLNPKDPTVAASSRQSCPDGGIVQTNWRPTPAGQTSQFNQRIRVAMSRISIARRTAALFRSIDLEHPPQVGFPVKPTLPTTLDWAHEIAPGLAIRWPPPTMLATEGLSGKRWI